MYTFSVKTLSTLFFLFLAVSLPATAFAQDKQNLSDAIREMIDNEGVESAKKHFLSMNTSERQQFHVDMEGISELTNDYLEEGNFDALTAISEISAPFMQDMISESMEQYAPGLQEMEQMADQRQAEREQKAKEREEERAQQRQKSVVDRMGEPRDDLDRFRGGYGDPDEPESTRQLWVNVSCDGYLVSGAMWGDVSPWWLRSESQNVFTFDDSFNHIRIEFTAGGTDLIMHHNLEFIDNPLQRVGPLPENWDPCVERYR